MNNNYEKCFVERFIRKDRRERLLYELSNTKKRKDALSRFCHNALEIIDKSKMVYAGEALERNDLKKYIEKYAKGEVCYVMSWVKEFDGKNITTDIALEHINSCGMVVILVFKNMLIIKEEQSVGTANEYILYDKR